MTTIFTTPRFNAIREFRENIVVRIRSWFQPRGKPYEARRYVLGKASAERQRELNI